MSKRQLWSLLMVWDSACCVDTDCVLTSLYSLLYHNNSWFLYSTAGAAPGLAAEYNVSDEVQKEGFGIDPDDLASIVLEHDVKGLKINGGVHGIAGKVAVSIDEGVQTSDVPTRQNTYGCNRYTEKPPRTFLMFVWEALEDLALIILMISAAVSIAVGIPTEGWPKGMYDGLGIILCIFLVVIVTAVSDYSQSLQFMDLDKEKKKIFIQVTRDGRKQEVSIYDLVVGDVVQLSVGDIVPADGIYLSGYGLVVDESSLSGESEPVNVNEENPFLLSGTKVHDGSAKMLVTAVGMRTEWGKLMETLNDGGEDQNPRQVKLSDVAIMFLVEKAVGIKWSSSDALMLLYSFSIAVMIIAVAIAKGLALAVTLSLAFAMEKLMINKAFVRQLSACETMGSAGCICTDKTGTLTTNHMVVDQIWTYGYARLQRAIYTKTEIFVHFQLTINVGALVVSFVSACITGSAPLTAMQLLWVNMITDTLGALAFFSNSMSTCRATTNQSSDAESDDADADMRKDNVCRAKRVRRAGARRTRAREAMRKQRQAVQHIGPTRLLTGLGNHPSVYIRLGQLPARHDLVALKVWNQAFTVWSTAADVYKELLCEAGFGNFLSIQRIMVDLRGYTSSLVERYFPETHTLHLGTFEIGPTPLAWTMITGIRFGGDPLNPPAITLADCARLLGLRDTEQFFSNGKLKLENLCPPNLDFREKPAEKDLEWMFRRLFVYLVGSCFFSETDLTVPVGLVSAVSNIGRINQYDWGAATFSAFLRGMRLKTSECHGNYSGFYAFLLFWAYEHLPCMRPVSERGLHTFPRACRWKSKMEDPTLVDFILIRFELEYLTEDEVNFEPYKELLRKEDFQHEIALSMKRIAFKGLESWEVYMGERNLRQFGSTTRIPCSPPVKRFCDKLEDLTQTFPSALLHGINARDLVEDGDYENWFRTNSLGRIVTAEHIPRERLVARRVLELWSRVHQDGHKVMPANFAEC